MPAPAPAPLAPPVDPATTHSWTGSTPTLIESYGQASTRQFGQLRVPNGKGPFPVALLIHGGCWAGLGHVNEMNQIADWLLARGVASWNVDYRDANHEGGAWPGTFQDWAGGLAALKTLGTRYPLDLTRITAIGHSAGVLPAVWLASGSQGDGVVAQDLPDIRNVIALDGPMDVAPFRPFDDQACGSSTIDALLGGSPESVPARYAMIDPVKNPPVIDELLVIQGWLPPLNQPVVDALQARGVRTKTVKVADDHFSLLMPGTADFNAYGEEMLRIVRGR